MKHIGLTGPQLAAETAFEAEGSMQCLRGLRIIFGGGCCDGLPDEHYHRAHASGALCAYSLQMDVAAAATVIELHLLLPCTRRWCVLPVSVVVTMCRTAPAS
jgi:hypothetical protein